MKYCSKCGEQLDDSARYCPRCGSSQEEVIQTTPNQTSKTSDTKTIAKIFMIVGCVLSAFYFLIPLCWTIPMTIYYFQSINEKKPVSIVFKVCTLLFVSLIAGILMLCDKDE